MPVLRRNREAFTINCVAGRLSSAAAHVERRRTCCGRSSTAISRPFSLSLPLRTDVALLSLRPLATTVLDRPSMDLNPPVKDVAPCPTVLFEVLVRWGLGPKSEFTTSGELLDLAVRATGSARKLAMQDGVLTGRGCA